eukprot:11321295-Alexandrium_andersonii.AAC.1
MQLAWAVLGCPPQVIQAFLRRRGLPSFTFAILRASLECSGLQERGVSAVLRPGETIAPLVMGSPFSAAELESLYRVDLAGLMQ